MNALVRAVPAGRRERPRGARRTRGWPEAAGAQVRRDVGRHRGGPALRASASRRRAARERPVVVVVSALVGRHRRARGRPRGRPPRRLDVAGFVAALRERHLALLGAVAPGKPALRAGAAVRARAAGRARGAAAGGGRRRRLRRPPTRAACSPSASGSRVPIVEAALRARGLDAHAVDAASLVRTDASFAEAAVDYAATRRLARAALGVARPAAPCRWSPASSAATEAGETTLLGRGGSDLTAAVLGWALDAERVEIWSDVDGVMTADPRLVPTARDDRRGSPTPRRRPSRARGAKVLHPRTLEPLEGAGIPVFVGNTLRPDGPGTWIGPADLRRPRRRSGAAREEAGEAGTAA